MSYLRELLAYGFASAAALVVDAGLLYYLVEVCRFRVAPAASISFASGAVVAYLLAVRFAFTNHRLANRRTEFFVFFVLGLLGLAVNAGVMTLGARLGFALLVTKAGAAAATFLCNFIFRRQVLFVIPADPRGRAHVLAE